MTEKIRLRTALPLMLMMVLVAPAAAQDEDATAPLLQAMAYLHPRTDPVGIDFVDWAQLKRLHGAEDVTSASPLDERQRFLLEVARNESVPVPLGLDRLATWADTWGWDTTDLDWQARYLDGRNVLHFREHWDPASFRVALDSFGYELDATGDIEVWRAPRDDMPSDMLLERVGAEIDAPETWFTSAPVSISDEGRTVVVHAHGSGAAPRDVRKAARPDLERVADTPAVRAAAALGDVVAGDVAGGREHLCRWPGEADTFADHPQISTILEGLHGYEARATGYTREAAGSPADVRYVFSYRRPRHARADLEGRAALVELGAPWDPASSALSLMDARVDGKELILDVQPEHGHPGPYGSWRITWDPFVMCGAPG